MNIFMYVFLSVRTFNIKIKTQKVICVVGKLNFVHRTCVDDGNKILAKNS